MISLIVRKHPIMELIAKIKRIMPFIATFVLIFVSEDTLLFSTNANKFFKIAELFITGLLLLFMFIMWLKKEFQLNVHAAFFSVILLFLMALSAIFNLDIVARYSFHFIYLFLFFITAVFFVSYVSFQKFTQYFCDILLIICGFSIVAMIIQLTIGDSFFVFAPTFQNTADYTFYFLGFTTIMKPALWIPIRNFGIFREPGIFQMYIILAFAFRLFYLKRKNLIPYFIYIGALALTFSPAAYISLFVLLGGFLLFKREKTERLFKIKLIVTFSAFALLALGVLVYLNPITEYLKTSPTFAKLFRDSASLASRANSIIANFAIFLTNPIFGVGLSKQMSLYPIYASHYLLADTVNNVNTLMTYLANFGIIFFIIFTIGLVKFCRKITDNTMLLFVVLTLILIMFCNENVSLSIFAAWIFNYGFFKTEPPIAESRMVIQPLVVK